MAAQPPDAPDGPARQPELAPPSPSEIDPLNPPSPTGRLTDDTPDGRTRLTPARRFLLSAYSAVAPPPRAGHPPLAEVLAQLDPQFARRIDDPMAELLRAATLWKDPSGPRIHPLQLAFASMAVLGRDPASAPRDDESFEPIVQILAPRDQRAFPDVEVDLRTALARAGAPDIDPRERWSVLRQEMGGNLAPELRPIRVAWCIPELRLVVIRRPDHRQHQLTGRQHHRLLRSHRLYWYSRTAPGPHVVQYIRPSYPHPCLLFNGHFVNAWVRYHCPATRQ